MNTSFIQAVKFKLFRNYMSGTYLELIIRCIPLKLDKLHPVEQWSRYGICGIGSSNEHNP